MPAQQEFDTAEFADRLGAMTGEVLGWCRSLKRQARAFVPKILVTVM